MVATLGQLARRSAGLVWSSTAEGEEGHAIVPHLDSLVVIVDLSVWNDLDSLVRHDRRSDVEECLRSLSTWLDDSPESMTLPPRCLWWVGVGHEPSRSEVRTNLERLAKNGPTPVTFTMATATHPPATESDRI